MALTEYGAFFLSFSVVLCWQADAVTKTELEMYDIHLLPPNEDPEICASWLHTILS